MGFIPSGRYGDCDDEQGEQIGPPVVDARNGANGIVLGNEALASEGVEDGAVGLQGAVSCINDLAWH